MKTAQYPNNIKELRLAAELTQHQLAVHADVSDKDIARWETGRNRILDPEVRRRLSSALGASIEYHASRDPEKIVDAVDQGIAASRRRRRGVRRPNGAR